MCTVTIVPSTPLTAEAPASIRMVCNRDESRRRGPADPPRVHQAGAHRALFPVDPSSAGTWIGVNEAGLVFTLLNANPGDMRGRRFTGRTSRGRIIRSLLEADGFEAAYAQGERLNAADFAPFRVLFTDGDELAELGGEGSMLWHRRQRLPDRPVMFTSSGLGDALVEGPRRALFDRWFGDDPGRWPGQQDSFHRHAWAGHGELSVCMAREDARTVSRTTVELDPGHGHAAVDYVSIEDQAHESPCPGTGLAFAPK